MTDTPEVKPFIGQPFAEAPDPDYRLDDETEKRIKELEDAGTFDYGRDGFTSDARNALRSRIRQLQEESYDRGFADA